MIPKERTYPVFEANQVLTNRHLNDLFEFLDEQNRLTRTNLIGIGIVCGLEFTVAADAMSITITKGCGVTSEGYLAVIPDDPTTTSPDSIVLESWKVYHSPVDVAYPPFNKADGSQYDLWELFPDGEPDSNPLTASFLQDKVLLLFVECNRENLKTCSPNSCDDKGQEVTVTLRKLLIFRRDLDEIIDKVKNGAANPGIGLSARLGLPDLRIRRFDVENTGVNTAAEIMLAYRSILLEPQSDGAKSLFQSVGMALSKAYSAFGPLVKNDEATDPFADHLAAIRSAFDTSFYSNQVIFTQYYYDFVADLIAAYDEFRQKGLKLMALCCPSSDLFPRHLMLGELQGVGRKRYRHYFQASSAQLQQAALAAEVRQLFRRLVAMVRNFSLPSFPIRRAPLTNVRITPSKLGPFYLSDKAIPFYFKVNDGSPALFEQWDFEKTSTDRAAQNLSYHADQYPSPEFTRNPLNYDFEPNNFLRIEGGVGLPWRDVVKDLLEKIRRFRLPIDLIALNADDFAVSRNPLPGHCIDNDLDIIYKSWLKESECLFKKKVGFFSSFDINSGKFLRLAATKTEKITNTGGRAATAFGAASATAFGGNTFTAMRFFPINDAVVTTGGSLGEVIKVQLDDQADGNVSAADLIVNAGKVFRENEKVKTMNTQDYDVVVEAPLRLIGAMAELTDAIPDDAEELDIAAAMVKYDNLKIAASNYLNNLVQLPPTYTFIPPAERDKAVDELKSLLDNCLDQRLNDLATEILRRRQVVAESIFFSNYVKKHPDIQHKAGAPTGGTFILIFRETPNTPTPGANAANIAAVNLADVAIAATANPAIGAVNRVGNAAATADLASFDKRKLSNVQANILSGAFVNAGLQFEFGNLVDAGVFEINPEIFTPRPKQLQIPEGVVIADFYLPYRCCSDCPPVQFVLPPARPAFTYTAACPNDNGFADVTINIVTGERPFELKIGEGETAEFKPFDPAQPIGLNNGETIVIRDSQGGESLPVKVEIGFPMRLDLGEITCNEAGDAFNVNIFIAGGKPPFFVNGAVPLSVEVLAAGHRIIAGPFASGQPLALEVRDSSVCPPQTIDIEHTCRPTPPVATNDTATTPFNSTVTVQVLANDAGSNLRVSIPTQPTDGVATVNPDGTISFTPNPNVSGKAVTITYQVTDSAGQTSQANVVVNVGASPCDLPCKGEAERCRYPLWLSKPNGQMAHRFTEIARLTIFDENGSAIFDEGLREIFEQAFAGAIFTNSNFNAQFKRLFEAINKRVADKLKPDFFTMMSNEFTHGGVLAVEKFKCHRFKFEVMFGAVAGNTNIVARWTYDENGVSVQQQSPAQAEFKLEKFGCDQINKCAQPEERKLAGRIKITDIAASGRNVVAVTEPDQNAGSARFNWLLEWSEQPFMEGKSIQPKFLAGSPKLRLIVVDKEGRWDYFEKSGANSDNPRGGGSTNPTQPGGGILSPTGRPVVVSSGNVRSTTDTKKPTKPPTKKAEAPATKKAPAKPKKSGKK